MTVAPDTGVTYAPVAGDRWTGVYRFDNVTENGIQVVSVDPIRVTNLTVTGMTTATLLTPTNLTVKAGATLTHPAAAAGNAASLVLKVSGTLTVEAGASIDVSERGYASGYSYPNVSPLPGDRTGGSHLGYGGVLTGPNGPTYGSAYRPGEAGGGGNGGSAGGGIVSITAGTLANDGSILANGGSAGYGSGAGGSIHVVAGTLSGAGSIQARGGENIGNVGAGGGGAIAIEYRSTSGSVLSNLLARGGTANAGRIGGAGTVYVKGPASTYGDLVVDNRGNAGQATELPSLGSGTLLAGTGATALVTDRSASIPAYFAGHWIEAQDGSGAVKGTYRITAIGADGKTVTVAPDTGVTYAPVAGDRWYGIYILDNVTLSSNSIVKTSDLFKAGTLTLGTGAQVLAPRVTTGPVGTAVGSGVSMSGAGKPGDSTVRGDGHAPRVRFLTPYLSPEEVPAGAEFVPSVEAFDQDGIASIEYFLDGEEAPCLAVDPALTIRVTRGCSIPNGKDGTVHRLRVRVTDLAGDTSEADAWLVIRNGLRIVRKARMAAEDPAVLGRVVYVEGELLVEGRLSLEGLYVRAGGSIRPAPDTNGIEGIEVSATGDIVIDAGGVISASGLGWGGGAGATGLRGESAANPGTLGGGHIRLQATRIVSSGLIEANGADSSALFPARVGLGPGGLVQFLAREGIFGPADPGGAGMFGVISVRAGQPVESEWGIPASSLGAGGEIDLTSPVVQIPGFRLQGSLTGSGAGHSGFVVVHDATHPDRYRLDGAAIPQEAEVGK